MISAVELVKAIGDADIRHLFDEAVLKMAEKAALQDEMHRRRSMKGALGTKLAADHRKEEFKRIATTLMKSQGFSSYRQLAVHVERRTASDSSVETIRKHLAKMELLK